MGCGPYLSEQELNQILSSCGMHNEMDRAVVAQATAMYGEQLVRGVVNAFRTESNFLYATFNAMNQISDIRGSEHIMRDLAIGLAGSGRKAQGAMFHMSYAVAHRAEIDALNVPEFRTASDGHEYEREGIDVLNKDGSVAELKCFNFESPYYEHSSQQVAERVVSQALSRLQDGTPQVTLVFSSWYGPMPQSFKSALDQAIGGNPAVTYRME